MLALLFLCAFLIIWWFLSPSRPSSNAPGPKPWPIIGSIHLLGNHETPFQAFTALSKIYGDIYSIHLGTIPCLVVNNFKLIKEVLVTKGADFGGRPDFMRFHKLFGGDRNNSLALCDWSSLQKTRRSIARTYCSPRFMSLQCDTVNSVAMEELAVFLSELQKLPLGKPCDLKPVVLKACANMFTKYMCSTSFSYDDKDFSRVVRVFDEIFWEINQGYAVDFMPWLLPMYTSHMKKISNWASEIRQFILKRIIDKHKATLDRFGIPRDFTDALLMHLEEDPHLNWQHIIFELEDFIGGHSAVGNLVMVALASVITYPEVQNKIRAEVDKVTKGTRTINVLDKEFMPYTEATIWEALRKASSPIVPHVATVDSTIDNFEVNKGTVIFLNNYELNMGEDYWDEPQAFKPERFISEKGQIIKPAHFIPFSTGKRTCIGQKLVQYFCFVILTALVQNYDITAGPIKLKPGCVAVHPDEFKLILNKRQ